MMITPETLTTFAQTPGLATQEQIQQIKEFLLEYKNMRDMYRAAFNFDPVGFTLESNLDTVHWYEDWHTQKQATVK